MFGGGLAFLFNRAKQSSYKNTEQRSAPDFTRVHLMLPFTAHLQGFISCVNVQYTCNPAGGTLLCHIYNSWSGLKHGYPEEEKPLSSGRVTLRLVQKNLHISPSVSALETPRHVRALPLERGWDRYRLSEAAPPAIPRVNDSHNSGRWQQKRFIYISQPERCDLSVSPLTAPTEKGVN